MFKTFQHNTNISLSIQHKMTSHLMSLPSTAWFSTSKLGACRIQYFSSFMLWIWVSHNMALKCVWTNRPFAFGQPTLPQVKSCKAWNWWVFAYATNMLHLQDIHSLSDKELKLKLRSGCLKISKLFTDYSIKHKVSVPKRFTVQLNIHLVYSKVRHWHDAQLHLDRGACQGTG